MSIAVFKQKNTILLLPTTNNNLSNALSSDWFDIAHWQQQQAVTGQATGRNTTWFITYQAQEWVLRHYYRGGLISKLIQDQYLFSTIEKTRCFQELALLEKMYQQGLPVPRPVAARIIKQRGFYTADIIIEKIPDSHDLIDKLTQQQMTQSEWEALGKLTARFHLSGIYHSDLNAHNILLDKQLKFWLIDFDKCDCRSINTQWQQSNLARLKRSFQKEKQLHQQFFYNEQCWQWLINAYLTSIQNKNNPK